MLSKGEKVFVITRRFFEEDIRRHFVGEVLELSGALVRVRGYAFVFDESTNQFVRREEQRTRIFSMIDAGVVINLIPEEVNLEEIRYRWNEKNQRIITDDKSFKMNVSEFGLYR
jgi:hypothetical protein